MRTYIFTVKLLWDKHIKRKIEVPEEWNLYRLAEAIMSSFNFDFDHPFGFFSTVTKSWDMADSDKNYELFADLSKEGMEIETVESESVKKTKVKEVWKKPKDQMMMLFDYGDDWRFIVELKTFGVFDKKFKYPILLQGLGKAPKQYG